MTLMNEVGNQSREVEEFLSWDSMMSLNFFKTADFIEEISPQAREKYGFFINEKNQIHPNSQAAALHFLDV